MHRNVTSSGQRQLSYAMSANLACRTFARLPGPLLRWSRAAFPSPQPPHYTFAYSVSKFRTFASVVDEEFFAPAGTSFSSLGLDERVCASLAAAGFDKAAHAQYLATSPILEGRNVVLAAETGSGKTLAYLAPLASLALAERVKPPTPKPETPPPADDWLEPLPEDEYNPSRPTATLVLCPNAALSQQVASVAAQAFTDPSTGKPLVNISLVSSANPPPYDLPDVVITTPGALATLLDGSVRLSEWTGPDQA